MVAQMTAGAPDLDDSDRRLGKIVTMMALLASLKRNENRRTVRTVSNRFEPFRMLIFESFPVPNECSDQRIWERIVDPAAPVLHYNIL